MKNSPPPPPPPSASPPPDAGPVTSVDNTLRLLLLIDERQALRVAEAADLLGVARSTAHRLLAALRRRDFVTQDRPNGAYRPGPALNALGLAAIGRIDIRRVARPILEDLREQTNETATLAILEGRMVRFVDSVESRRSVRVGNRTGVVRAAHASAVGKALLAELPRREFEQRYPDEHLDGGAAGAISTRAALEEELDQVRAQGYALNAEESIEGVSAVAVALRDVTGKPVAAMGLAAPSSRMRADALREIAPTMLAAADRIRQEMSRPV